MGAVEKLELSGAAAVSAARARARTSKGSEFFRELDEASVEAVRKLSEALGSDDKKTVQAAARDIIYARSRLPLDPTSILSSDDGEQRERIRALLRNPPPGLLEDLGAAGWTRQEAKPNE